MFKNTGSQKLTVFAFDAATNLPKTGDAANLTAYCSIDDGTLTALTDTSATEVDSTNGKGYYTFDLTQAETNGNKLLFTCKSSTSNVVVVCTPAVVYTRPPNFSSLSIDADGRVDVSKILGTTLDNTGTGTTGANSLATNISRFFGSANNLGATIIGFQAVAAVDSVTDKLDSMIQLDGADYEFKAAALEEAPTGGGGTVNANVTQILGTPLNDAGAGALHGATLADNFSIFFGQTQNEDGDAAGATDIAYVQQVSQKLNSMVQLDGADYEFKASALEEIPAAPTAVQVADAVLSRSVSNVEGTAPEHSLTTVVLACTEMSISGTTLTIKRTDGSTTHASKTISTEVGAAPVTGIS